MCVCVYIEIYIYISLSLSLSAGLGFKVWGLGFCHLHNTNGIARFRIKGPGIMTKRNHGDYHSPLLFHVYHY